MLRQQKKYWLSSLNLKSTEDSLTLRFLKTQVEGAEEEIETVEVAADTVDKVVAVVETVVKEENAVTAKANTQAKEEAREEKVTSFS